jgi:hypothetical protein
MNIFLSTDILQEISILTICLVEPSPLSIKISYIQAVNQTHLLYSRSIHSMQILYMTWALFKSITQKSIISNKEILKFTIYSNAVALGISLTYFLLITLFPELFVLIFIIFASCFQDIPFILIGFPLIWFYYHIRKTLKQEFLLTIQIAQQKREIAKRLIVYPIIYLIYSFLYVVALLAFFLPIDSPTELLVLNMLFCMYPLMNSVVYGISNSTKRFMYVICLKDREYEDIEEVENELRNENLLAPRVYCDLLNNK